MRLAGIIVIRLNGSPQHAAAFCQASARNEKKHPPPNGEHFQRTGGMIYSKNTNKKMLLNQQEQDKQTNRNENKKQKETWQLERSAQAPSGGGRGSDVPGSDEREGEFFFFLCFCHSTKNVHGDLQANYRKHPLAILLRSRLHRALRVSRHVWNTTEPPHVHRSATTQLFKRVYTFLNYI